MSPATGSQVGTEQHHETKRNQTEHVQSMCLVRRPKQLDAMRRREHARIRPRMSAACMAECRARGGWLGTGDKHSTGGIASRKWFYPSRIGRKAEVVGPCRLTPSFSLAGCRRIRNRQNEREIRAPIFTLRNASSRHRRSRRFLCVSRTTQHPRRNAAML